jgi:DNA polymerase elongation subunit (family B)
MMYGRLQETFSLLGLPILDYIDLYKKYAPKYSQESYKLDYIAHVELGEKKLDYSEYGSLRTLYKENYQKFIEYNIKDVILVNKLNEKLRLLELVYKLAYSAKVNYDDVLGQVRVWDNLIFSELKKQDLVVPMHKTVEGERTYSGGYVKEPIIGKHKWVASFDVNALYPSLIRMLNLSPETLIDEEQEPIAVEKLLNKEQDNSILKERDLTFSAAGYKFNRKITGILPYMMQKLYEERKFYKQKALEEKQELERVKTEIEKRGIDEQN